MPEPLPFDPSRSDAPPLPAPDDGSPGVVLLVVASAAREHEWAERAAAALAAGWADQGRRILLADFALTRPGLHRVLDVGNGEGVSDAFLFGSSVKRVARPVRDGRFLFMPAGTATARPEDVTSSPRWAAIVDACASVRATLVAFLPSDLPGGEALLRWSTDVLLLTDPASVRHESLARGLGPRLRGILVPANGRMEVEEPAAAAPPPLVADPEPPAPELPAAEPPADEAEEWTAPLPLIAPEETAAVSAPADAVADAWADEVPADYADVEEDAAPLPMLEIPVDIATPEESAGEVVELPLLASEPETEAEASEPLPTFDLGAEPDVEAVEDAVPLPLLDPVPAEPAAAESAATVTDPWAEAEAEHQRAGDAGGAESDVEGAFGLEIDSVPPDATTGAAAVAVSGAEALPDAGLDFADIQATTDPLLPEPVTAEQAKEAATVFDLSSFDGMVEDAPPPPARQPVILESEEEPVVAGDLAAAAPARAAPAADAPAGFDLAGAIEHGAPPPARPARPTRPAPAATAPRPAPVAKPVAKKESGGTGSLVMALLIFAVLIAVALAWFDVVRIPWLSDFLAARRPAPTTLAPVPAPSPELLGASLALGAFTDAPVARLQAEALGEQRPELLFVVAPVELDGVVYHRLLAGPAHDADEAAALRGPLGELLTREDPASWPLQRTPLAFVLGQTDDLAAARARVEALSRVDIPAYVLELPAPPQASAFVQVSARGGGEGRYRVYAGAYADLQEAAYLAGLLARRGEPMALIERTGRHIE